MPTYQYACNDCGQQLEVVQKFTDDALKVCPNCEGNLRKVFSAVGIVFKGSGFYKTDSRSTSTASSSSSSSSSKSTETKSGDSGSSSSSGSGSSTPAATPAAASS